MTMKYLRDAYGVPVRRGGRVRYTTATRAVRGSIVSARGAYVRIRWDGTGRITTHHPTEDGLVYEDGEGKENG